MAGNNAIQILRGSRDKIIGSTQTLKPGQLLYNTTDNYLSVGKPSNGDLTSTPIVTREIVGYTHENSGDSISTAPTVDEELKKYSITYKGGKGLKFHNPVVVTNVQGNVTATYPASTMDGIQAFAIGKGCQASGNQSFAGGVETLVAQNQNTSFAFGEGLKTSKSNEAIFGKYNNISGTTQLFAVGNGTSKTSRHNAFTIFANNPNNNQSKNSLCYVTADFEIPPDNLSNPTNSVDIRAKTFNIQSDQGSLKLKTNSGDNYIQAKSNSENSKLKIQYPTLNLIGSSSLSLYSAGSMSITGGNKLSLYIDRNYDNNEYGTFQLFFNTETTTTKTQAFSIAPNASSKQLEFKSISILPISGLVTLGNSSAYWDNIYSKNITVKTKIDIESNAFIKFNNSASIKYSSSGEDEIISIF